MVGQLDFHRALDEALRQTREQAAGPNDLLLAARPGQQLVDQLVREPLANVGRQPVDGARRWRRRLA
jgi:hypothetical protein